VDADREEGSASRAGAVKMKGSPAVLMGLVQVGLALAIVEYWGRVLLLLEPLQRGRERKGGCKVLVCVF
jgi:hypothetical protein